MTDFWLIGKSIKKRQDVTPTALATGSHPSRFAAF